MERSNSHPYNEDEDEERGECCYELYHSWDRSDYDEDSDEEDSDEEDSGEESEYEEYERSLGFVHNGITYLRVIDNDAIYSLNLEYLGNFRNGVIVYDYTHRDPTSIIDEALWRERLH